MNNLQKYLIIACLLLSPTWLMAQNDHDTPRLLLFLGRFHPVILHLPIGALVFTFIIDLYGRWQKQYQYSIVKLGLGFSAITAVLASVLGYLLSLEGGYEKNALDNHLYTGIFTAVLTVFLYYLIVNKSAWSKKIMLPMFAFLMIVVSITGHLGSILTHGEAFLTEYAKAPPKPVLITEIDSLRYYPHVIKPIFEDKCTRCHNNSKKKGDLNLINPNAIAKGGENGDVLVAFNALESKIFTHPLLPLKDDDHMPPEGKPQLTKDELWLIENWINLGADYNQLATQNQENDTLNSLLKNYLILETKRIPKADFDEIQSAKNKGFAVNQIMASDGGLAISFLGNELSSGQLNVLKDLKKQIVELNLNNSGITNSQLAILKSFKNLKVLKLNDNGIEDVVFKYLKKLNHLQSLHLYNTKVTLKGLEAYLEQHVPSQIYVWQNDINVPQAQSLAQKYETDLHVGLIAGFVEKTPLRRPTIFPENTLFKDTLAVELSTKLRNVDIRYTLDGTEPDSTSTLFEKPIVLKEPKVLKYKSFKTGWLPSETVSTEYSKIGHVVEHYTIVKEPDPRYPDSRKLFDLVEGSNQFKDGKWNGYLGVDVNTTVDFEEKKSISQVSVNCLENTGNWIFFPVGVKIYVADDNEGPFKLVGELPIKRNGVTSETIIKKFTVEFEKIESRYLKVVVQSPKILPDWHPGAGNDAWIFVDEIVFW